MARTHPPDRLAKLDITRRREERGARRQRTRVSAALARVAVGVGPHAHFAPQEQLGRARVDARSDVVPAARPAVWPTRRGAREVKVGTVALYRTAAGRDHLWCRVAGPGVDDRVGRRRPRIEVYLLPPLGCLSKLSRHSSGEAALEVESGLEGALALDPGLITANVPGKSKQVSESKQEPPSGEEIRRGDQARSPAAQQRGLYGRMPVWAWQMDASKGVVNMGRGQVVAGTLLHEAVGGRATSG